MPLFHDFGFVAPVLQPLRLGCRTVFIATQRFILRPATWVQAVSRCRGTVSGGPTFAYDLVVDRITFDELAELDLSTWQHAIIGSEPINAATIERFRAAFEPVGLSPTAVTGGFGLAEETCLLTADRGPARPTVRRFCRHGLARGLASPSDGADSVPLVGCGQVVAGHELAIVDAESRQRLPDGRIGEIWAAGPSVAQRYRDAPEASASAFVAPPPGMFSAPATTALRTGDLGFWLDDQLYVTGRTKDVIIIRGENHLPHHLESVATQSDPRLAGLRAAAFSVPTSEGEGLVVLQECAQWDQPAAAQIIAGIQAAVVASHGIRAHDIRLLAPGQIPRTPSGKVKRGMCRQRYLSAERFC
jgi:nonribosomal peptide synthetase protein BlmVI